MKRFVSVLIVLVLLAAACSEDDGDSQSAGEDAPAEQQEGAQPGDDDEEPTDLEVQEIVEAGLLQLEDFPSGWREGEPENVDLEMEEIDECSDLAPLRTASIARSESLAFTRGEDDSEVENSVDVYEDEATAKKVVDAFASADATECLNAFTEEAVRRGFAEEQENPFGAGGPDDIEIQVGRISLDPVGDQVAGWQQELVLSADGFEVEVFGDQLIVRVGRAVTNVSFVSVFTPFFEGDREPLIEPVVSRLERAQRAAA